MERALAAIGRWNDGRLSAAAHRLSPGLWVLVWLGLALMLPGLLLPRGPVALAFLVASTTVFALALVVIGLNRRYLASERHFHESLDLFVQNDAAATLLTDSHGVITYANRAARRRFGDDAPGKSLVLLLHGWSANPVNTLFSLQQRALQQGSAQRDIVTSNGHLRLSVTALGRQGFVWRLEELAEFDESGAERGRAIGLPMLLATRGGRVLHANRALAELVGGVPAHLDRLFTDLPLRDHGLHLVATEDGPRQFRVVRHGRENGIDEIFLIACAADELAGARPEQILDALPVALVKLRGDGRILTANLRAREMLGLTDAAGADFSRLIHGLGRPVRDWLEEALRGGGRSSEVVQPVGAGKDTYLRVTLSRIIEEGEPRLFAVISDATELKTLEAQVVQSQKMQAIGQLTGGIAHDFNNLLTAISGYCDLLLMRRDASDPDYADLMQISQNANRAAALVGQLLAFSRKQNLNPEILDLSDTLSDLSHLLNRLLGEKVTLRVETAPGLDRILADRRKLEQVLMNLVVNARDAMPGGGEVVVSAENLHLDSDLRRERARVPAGDYVRISVRDSGTGIPDEIRARIFEPFFTTKDTGKGTGLGLSVVYGIVKQSGGFVFVDSTPGQGTVFQILLRAHRGASRNRAEGWALPRVGAPQLAVQNGQRADGEGKRTGLPKRAAPADAPVHTRAAGSGAGGQRPEQEMGGPAAGGIEGSSGAQPAAGPGQGDRKQCRWSSGRVGEERVSARPGEGGGAASAPGDEGRRAVCEGGTGRGVVLLVEDEAPVRAFAARALRMRGFKVLEAADADAALAILADPRLRVDVFVTDVVMPGRDGPSWVREALTERPEARVVFVSGYAEEALAADRASIENAIFLPKPFSLEDLTSAVLRQLVA